jgi:hypothetical protein
MNADQEKQNLETRRNGGQRVVWFLLSEDYPGIQVRKPELRI